MGGGGHYELLGDAKENKLVPAVNILLNDVNVFPGERVNGYIELSYNYRGLHCEVGYQFNWQNDEEIFLQDTLIFESDRYGIASKTYYISDAPFGSSPNHFKGGEVKYLSDVDIATQRAAKPGLFLQRIYSNISYDLSDSDLPLCKIGCYYDVSSTTFPFFQWGAYAQIALLF